MQFLLPHHDRARRDGKSGSSGSAACNWNCRALNVVIAQDPRLQSGLGLAARDSIIKTAGSTFQSILNQLRPDELYDARIVIAIREIVVQSRETMALASSLHVT